MYACVYTTGRCLVLCPLTFKGGKRNEKLLLLLLRYFAEMAAKNRFIFQGRFFCVVVYEGETCYDWAEFIDFSKKFLLRMGCGLDTRQIFQTEENNPPLNESFLRIG